MELLGIDLRIWLKLVLVVVISLLPVLAYLIPVVFDHLVVLVRLSRARLPGPDGGPFLGLAIYLANSFRKPEKTTIGTHILTALHGMCQLFPKIGIININMGYFLPMVLVYKADTVEAVLKNSKHVKKTREYFFARGFFGYGLVTSSPEKWKKERKVLQPSFHPRILDTYQPSVSLKTQLLVDKLRPMVGQKCASLRELISNCALDNVCGTSLGFEIGDYDSKSHPLIDSIDEVTSTMMPRVANPFFWPNPLYRLSNAGRAYHAKMKVLLNYSKKMVMNARTTDPDNNNSEGQRLPFLRHLLRQSTGGQDKVKFSEMDIIDHIKTITVTGYDSPASAMIWATYFLGLYPDVQQRAFEEINAVFGGDKDRPITIEDLKKMTYLECVIKESLRVVPIIPMIGRILDEDQEIGGHIVPKGTSIFVMLWTLHRDPKVFPDPEIFNPDRFVNRKYSPFEFAPFSAGPRGCIGYMFAMQEMKTVLSNLLRNFRWTSLDPFDVVFPSWGNVTVHPNSQVRLSIEER